MQADICNGEAMRRVVLESPFAGDEERNAAYARDAMRDALSRGEAPLGSHVLFAMSGVLCDALDEERALGIAAGLEWGDVAEATVVYEDFGISAGMRQGIERAEQAGRPVEYRRLWPASGAQ